MANVLLTDRCVRACPYCFAKGKMNTDEASTLEWKDFMYIADFFSRAGEMHMSLLGGEPSLHPNFVEYILYLIERKFHVTVFTSGIFSDATTAKVAKSLSKHTPEQLSFVCNVNEPRISSESELEKQHRFLDLFGHYTTLSYNIYDIDFDLSFLFDYINRYGLNRAIRFGQAHPIYGEQNIYITPPDLKKMAQRFMEFEDRFAQFNVSPNFDCGIPLCIFDDQQLGKLYRFSKGMLKFGCGAAIDIGPDMSVWACFPLFKYKKKSLYEFDTFKDMIDYFNANGSEIRHEQAGLYPECNTCREFLNGVCSGGCLVHALNRMSAT